MLGKTPDSDGYSGGPVGFASVTGTNSRARLLISTDIGRKGGKKTFRGLTNCLTTPLESVIITITKGLVMADMTKEQYEMADKEMQALVFKDKLTVAEAKSLPKYPGSDNCEFDKLYYFNDAMAIMRVGQTKFKFYDVR